MLYSNIYVVKKKDGAFKPVINLNGLNLNGLNLFIKDIIQGGIDRGCLTELDARGLGRFS